MNVTLDHVEQVAKNIHTFWFKPDEDVTFIAGQYIEMYLPHDNPDNRGQKRWFTLSSSPSEELLGITTKHYGDPISSFKQHLFDLQPGDKLTFSEPMGDFVLPKDTSIPLLFVVGGIGVTPVRSILAWLIHSGEKRSVKLIYGVRSLEDIAFKDIFDTFGITPQIVLSEPDARWDGDTGHITTDMIRNNAEPNTLIYISGPEPLTEKLEAELKATGTPPSQLVLDFFPGYPII